MIVAVYKINKPRVGFQIVLNHDLGWIKGHSKLYCSWRLVKCRGKRYLYKAGRSL